MGAIEDIALDLIGGVRGGKPAPRLVELRPYLAFDYMEDAARFMLDHPNRAMIITGFFIPVPYKFPLPEGGSVETDGPPGAYFLGEALRALDFHVTYVADRWFSFVFDGVPGAEDYVEFPMADFKESDNYSRKLLEEKDPSVVISTERCGLTRERRYLNMMGWDISEFTAKLDYLLENHPHTVAVGDAGNELGMGNFAPFIGDLPHPLAEPAVVPSTKPVLGRSSDWGCYGLVTALSKLAGRDLLPTGKQVQEFIVDICDRGVVRGDGRKGYEVDNRTLEEQGEVLDRLRGVLKDAGIEVKSG